MRRGALIATCFGHYHPYLSESSPTARNGGVIVLIKFAARSVTALRAEVFNDQNALRWAVITKLGGMELRKGDCIRECRPAAVLW